MQYALIAADPEGQSHFLVDASELALLNEAGIEIASITDEAPDESAFVWRVVYGALMPSPLHADADPIARMQSALGCGFGRIVTEPTLACRVSEIRDIEIFPAIQKGLALHYPIAALIGTIEIIPAPERFGLTRFPRYIQEMDVLTNVINRSFLLSLKGEEERAIPALNPLTASQVWRKFIKAERATEIAWKCG